MTEPKSAHLDLDAIEARANAATPGPWHRGGTIYHANRPPRSNVWPPAEPGFASAKYMVCENATPIDAEFIAHARDDVPSLVAEVRRHRAVNDGHWDDRPTDHDSAIDEAHPVVSGNNERYGRALAMVEAKHSKYALVDLVNWLLTRIESGGGEQ